MTHASEPAYKVGDKVKVTATPAPGDPIAEYIGRSGSVEEVDSTEGLFPFMVRFSGGLMDYHWFGTSELTHLVPAPPLGVEPWRLLFRAHRNGWELLTEHRPDALGPERCRWWHNANTGQVFAFTTVEVR